jgi:hypothetical protein
VTGYSKKALPTCGGAFFSGEGAGSYRMPSFHFDQMTTTRQLSKLSLNSAGAKACE